MSLDAERLSPDLLVVGLGYIGLPTAALAAQSGLRVLGCDIDPEVVATVASGRIHLEEDGLEELVSRNVQRGRLSASTQVENAKVYLVAVPTPVGKGNRPDISFVESAVEAIAPCIAEGDLIIIESTAPIGTTESARDIVAGLRPDLVAPTEGGTQPQWHIAYCPERVIPGKTLSELVSNDRSVGGITTECARRAIEFYENFVTGHCTPTTARVAEMVKLVENSFRDVNIAFANELSLLADTFSIDVWEVISLANNHPRVNILQPGPGVGGHCIAVDPWFLVAADPENSRLIRTAREVNDGKAHYVVEKVLEMVERAPSLNRNDKIACLGLAFKPDIDDFRGSPAMDIAVRLAQRFGDRVMVAEPHARELPEALKSSGVRLLDADAAIAECDNVVLLVDHREFRAIDRAALSDKSIYDTRGVWR